MNDSQLLRYSRHILLEEIGVEGQERLLAANALVIGAGGLGSPAALYLGSAGVGRITVVDHDRVDTTNLQRQIAHTLARVGTFKADSIATAVILAVADRNHATRPSISLADATCLAVARRLDLPVVTGDRQWTDLSLENVTIRLFR